MDSSPRSILRCRWRVDVLASQPPAGHRVTARLGRVVPESIGDLVPGVATFDFHVTSECSQECPYCWGPQDIGEVDTDTALAIVAKIAASGARRIVFTGGDPLKRADIGELIHSAKRHGLEVAVSTTGDELTAAFLDRHGADIDLVSLPLDGATEEVSSRTKKEGHFTAVMAALDLLAVHPDIDVKVATPVTRFNIDDIPNIVTLLEERARRSSNRLFYNVFQAFPRSMDPDVAWDQLIVTAAEFAALQDRVGGTRLRINWLSHETLDRLYVMVFPDGRLTIPSGSAFAFYGDFLEVEGLDDVLARAEFDVAKHRRHAEGWHREG
ncbi:cyclic pyranopterin monophosphate synthase 1 [bacterium BMS3Abin02]|nr:cyclic pyranopterin monophosphate synthase 1 [bacterium BMS3Abin02]